ncbi:uncharacterized protein KGF55_001014 [Candida pseudojiufengensis]|uniref:uncharacterized protein n=1 Tax=Candida pseudojiufengensis TaxID=497109 RepID=UPI002224F290|nr:uncharacterized protein KGF55_001014 [Candida pseudojiufengensis]KAI5965652.1 hypothetical protein KGF55_001014 [Candida pseudojiufengensis]
MSSQVDQRSSSPPFKKQRLDSLTHSFTNTNNSNNNVGDNKINFQVKNDQPKESVVPDIILISDDEDEKPSSSEEPIITKMENNVPEIENNVNKNENDITTVDDESDDDDEIVILSENDVKSVDFKPSSFNSSSSQQQQQQPGSQPQSQPLSQPGLQQQPQTNQQQPQQQQQQQPNNSQIPPQPIPLIPGSFNQPAPVPHVTDNLQNISQAELKARENDKTNQIAHLEKMKKTITGQIQTQTQLFEKENDKMKQLNLKLNHFMGLGNHDAVAKIRRVITVVQRAMNGPRNNINHLQSTLNNVEKAIVDHRNALSLIMAKLRDFGHVLNAAINPYAAQIVNDMANNPEPNVAIQDLLNEIHSEENLEKEGLANTPMEMSVNLLKHQRIGLTWLLKREDPKSKSKGGVLADDMGLGKTIQTLALIVANKSNDPNCKTTLIIAPVSLLRQWAAEIQSKLKPAHSLKVGIYHGDEKKQMVTFSSMKKFDVILTSYGTLASEWKRHYAKELKANVEGKGYIPRNNDGGKTYDSPFFSKTSSFYRIVLDEAQNIKNKFAIASRAVTNLKAEFRFCLSGTPMQNKIDELYPILRFLKLRPYCDETKFRADISNSLKSKSDNYDDFDRTQSMRKLRALLSSMLLRRNKNSKIDGEPILNLPEKHLISDFVNLESDEWNYYKSVETGIQRKVRKMIQDNDRKNALVLLLRLRQACIHSYLVEISQIKAQMKKKNLIKAHWKNQLANAMELSDEIVASILLKGLGDLACPICLDMMDEGMAVFKECGHIICQDCIDTFMDDQLEDEDSSGRIAKCKECHTNVKESKLFDFEIFEKLYVEKLSKEEIEKYFSDLQKSKSLTNQQIIQKLNRENEGFDTSAKLDKAIELIKDIQRDHPGEKIIVFSQFTTVFDLLKIVLNHEKVQHLRYDGSLSMEVRNNIVKQFYQGSSDVLLLSLRAGNVGLTLTCANHVILMDPFWNPFVEEQAMDRAHRIGQQKEVHVHKILIRDTVEDRIMTLQQAKKDLISDALNEKELKNISGLNRSELGFLFGLNALRR